MGSKVLKDDEQAAANLLWQLKAIATKEVESLPVHCIDSFFLRQNPSSSSSSSDNNSSDEDGSAMEDDTRGRTVSVGSVDMVYSSLTPVLSFHHYHPSKSPKPFLLDDDTSSGRGTPTKNTKHNIIDHHDWSNQLVNPKTSIKKSLTTTSQHPLLCSPKDIIKQCKKKRESYVGRTTNTGVVRATLRKKFSWKQYPELEGYLLKNQDEYFEYSSRNYTPEQRKYNNGLTRGLLDLAAEEGYVFEDFKFSEIRDRIRCFYKSHSQSAKKKRRR
jgi:hypothetical protein